MDRIVASVDCGMVIPYDDIPALEAALRLLASDAALRRRLGENARRAYEETYSWGRMQTRLQALYASLCPLLPEGGVP
jgi:glycosyltransferase involved in cell wall biosynthesis